MYVKKLVLEPLDNNCYFIINDSEVLIVDPSGEEEKIEEFLKSNNLILKGILITHYHFDHIGALDCLVNKYKVPVYDYKMNGKQVCSNFKFKIISTKGHSKDSVSFYFEEILSMFVGDFVFYNSIGRMDLEGGDEEEMAYSLSELKKMDPNIKLYPGHGSETSLKHEIEYNPYL